MSVDKKSELKIRAIENGTVIDHITANKSLHILKILLPNTITGIIKCTNSKCITNYANEPIAPKFNVINNHPPVVRCHYCEKLIKTEDIEKQFE